MNLKNLITRIDMFATKRRNRPVAISFPFSKTRNKKSMSDKKTKSRIEELESLVSSQAELIASTTKALSELRREVNEIKDLIESKTQG